MNKILSSARALSGFLAVSASLLSLPAVLLAQEPQEARALEEIVVTGTRLRADGFEAPTPVTSTPIADLRQSNPTNIVDALQELPQFIGSRSFNSGGKAGISSGRGQTLDLRNFGSQRTLILLDGIRLPPTTYTGFVNSEIIPQMLLERVDVVTAGASAAYGSDAVAGAVNYVIDHDFTGMKVESSAGISKHGDSFDYRAGVAGGFELGERGHFLFSLERFETDGIKMKDRGSQGKISYIAAGKTRGGGPPGTTGNPLVIYENARWLIISDGGHALGGPLFGTYFPRAGEYRFFDFGTPTGSGASVVGGDGTALQIDQTITEDAASNQAFFRLDYDFGAVRANVMGVYSIADVDVTSGFNYFNFGQAVFSGNPFIPTGLQERMTAEGIDVFYINKYVTDSPLSPAKDDTDHFTLMLGLEGDIGERLTWNLNYAHGRSDQFAEEIDTPELRKFHAAADAVVDRATGRTVCRVSLTHPGLYPGCVPFNVMGVNAASPEAVDYIHGTGRYDADTTLDQVTLSLNGTLFDLPAGPLSFAVGGEYRKQDFKMTSNTDPAVDRPVTGLRSLAPGAPRFWFATRASADADLNVKEVFGEVNVPLLADMPLFHSLDVNGAIRRTDYSTSGAVTTWKVGGTWRPVEDVLFRITGSRDIRAPTLFDLGQSGAAGRSTLNDPQTGAGGVVLTAGGGNPNLFPEEADSLSFGVVVQPSFLPGLSIALDFFDLELEGAIATLSTQNVVDQCFFSGGEDPICGQVQRPISASDTSPENFPTLVLSGPTNSSLIDTKGFDLEVSYATELGGGSLGGRLFLTYIDDYKTQASPFLPVVETAGTHLIPDLKAHLQVHYTRGAWSLLLQERMIGKLTLGYEPNQIWDEPPVSAQYYTDITGSYTWSLRDDRSLQLYLSIRNLFDNKPPLVPNTAAPRYNFPTLAFYDIVGTMFTAGVKVNL